MTPEPPLVSFHYCHRGGTRAAVGKLCMREINHLPRPFRSRRNIFLPASESKAARK